MGNSNSTHFRLIWLLFFFCAFQIPFFSWWGFIPVVTSVGNILLLLRFCSSSRDYTVAIQNSLISWSWQQAVPLSLDNRRSLQLAVVVWLYSRSHYRQHTKQDTNDRNWYFFCQRLLVPVARFMATLSLLAFEIRFEIYFHENDYS